MASPGGPMGSKMPPKRDPKSSKNGLLRPASPRRPPKPPPGSKKPPKSKENRHKTASSPRGKKNRGSGALQRTASRVCPRTSRKNSRWWRPSEDKIAGVFADLVENIGAPHHCTHPPSAADWAKPNWIIYRRAHRWSSSLVRNGCPQNMNYAPELVTCINPHAINPAYGDRSEEQNKKMTTNTCFPMISSYMGVAPP